MNRIKECRVKKGMTQKFVALSLGVKPPSVWGWENDKSDPTQENLSALADLFGVSVDYLLGREDHIQTEAEAIVEHYVNAQGGRPTGALAFSPNPINAARESIRKDADQFSPETMSVIESILAKLEQLDDADRKIAEEHIDFLLSRKKGE